MKAICAIAAMTSLFVTIATGSALAFGLPIGPPTWFQLTGDACLALMVLVLIFDGE